MITRTQEQYDFVGAWIKALKSGNYEQTKDVLHNVQQGGFCCLGVLCEIDEAVTKAEVNNSKGIPRVEYQTTDVYFGIGSIPDEYFMEKTGFNGCDKDGLISLNDDSDSFERVIERLEWLQRKYPVPVRS